MSTSVVISDSAEGAYLSIRDLPCGGRIKQLEIPYGDGRLSCSLPTDRVVSVLEPSSLGGVSPQCDDRSHQAQNRGEIACSEYDIVRRAMENPIASPRLRELATGKSNIVILTSDHTRPVPSHITIPLMLDEIRSVSPNAQITILIGVGSHRAMTAEEITKRFGRDIAERERVINHDPRDDAGLVSLGTLPSGGSLVLNRYAVEADLLIADGFIEPHQFAGFSGGRKSVLPGVASLVTVLASHNSEFTVHPAARPGSLEGNPFHKDMIYAARRAKLAFILNVALSSDKRVIAAFAGDMEEAHLEGCRFVMDHSGVEAVPAPIVITSNGGYPLDQNIYQSTKSIMAADLTCESGGVIIAVNECRDGHGGEAFHSSFKGASSLDSLLDEIEARSKEETRPDQWVTQLTASILRKRRVIFVSSAPRELVEDFGMVYAADIDEALKRAELILGVKDAPITALPNAVSLLVRSRSYIGG